MSVEIVTNSRGQEEIVGANSRGQKHVLLPDKIFMRLSDGHIFLAPSIQLPLSRLNPHEVPMIEHWLRERGAEIGPDVFDGEPSRE